MNVNKPLLTLEAGRLFYAIIAYAKRYKRSSTILDNAASDVMDGWKEKTDPEVKELIHKEIIERCAGSWVLTEKGKQIIKG